MAKKTARRKKSRNEHKPNIPVPATRGGKDFALAALEKRREQAKKEKQIDNGALHAGSPMYYYCKSCGLLADTMPELWDTRLTQPKKLCDECQALKDAGWLQ